MINKMDKEIIVMGDIEMGAGNLTDDFISDKTLSHLILQLSKRQHPVDLVLNGDIFDFLKCPYVQDGKRTYPRHITAEISVGKLHLIKNAHPSVFEALRIFAASSTRHNIYFIIGNHDHDLFFPEVKMELKHLLGNKKTIHFPGLKYDQHGVYVEHGHQYDFLHQINFENIFLHHKGKSLLNFPWASFGLISTFMDMKERHPFVERISPRPLLFSLHRMVLRKVSLRSLGYFLKSVLYYPFRYYSDPTYTFPRRMFGEFYQRLKHGNWDVDNIIDVFRKKKRGKLQRKVFVLGHVHRKYLEEYQGSVVINPGAWRDEYRLDAKTRTLLPKNKHYVQIILRGKEVLPSLQELPLKRSTFLFDEVIKDELAYIHLAAQEEGFQLML